MTENQRRGGRPWKRRPPPRFMSILDFSLKSLVNDIVRRVFLRFDIQFHVENPRPLPNIPEIRFRRFNQGFRVGFLLPFAERAF